MINVTLIFWHGIGKELLKILYMISIILFIPIRRFCWFWPAPTLQPHFLSPKHASRGMSVIPQQKQTIVPPDWLKKKKAVTLTPVTGGISVNVFIRDQYSVMETMYVFWKKCAYPMEVSCYKRRLKWTFKANDRDNKDTPHCRQTYAVIVLATKRQYKNIYFIFCANPVGVSWFLRHSQPSTTVLKPCFLFFIISVLI